MDLSSAHQSAAPAGEQPHRGTAERNENTIILLSGRVILPRRFPEFGLIVRFALLLFLKLFLLGVCFVNVSYTFCRTTKVRDILSPKCLSGKNLNPMNHL